MDGHDGTLMTNPLCLHDAAECSCFGRGSQRVDWLPTLYLIVLSWSMYAVLLVNELDFGAI